AATAFPSEVVKATNLADQLQDLAEQYDVSATSIQRVGNVAKTAGGSLEGVAASYNFINKSAAEAIEKGGELAATYERLGISVDELRGTSPEEIFLKIADSVSTTTDRQRAYADVLAVMGRSSGSLVATLSQGREQIIAAGEAFGTFASDEDVQRLAEAKDQIAQISNQLTIFAGTVAASALELKQAGEDYGVFGEYALILQGALSQLSGGTINLDFASPIIEAQDSMSDLVFGAEEAAPAVAAVAEATKAIESQPAQALTDGLITAEQAAKNAEAALRDMEAAAKGVDDANARLARAALENAKAQIALKEATGELTKQQADWARANLENDERAARSLREQRDLQEAISAAQQKRADLADALASAEGETADRTREALDSVDSQIASLEEQLAIVQQINAEQAGEQQAERAISAEKDRQNEAAKQAADNKKQEAAAAVQQVEAERAINAEILGRPSAPLQRSPLGPSPIDQPIDINRPVQPTDLGPDVSPRQPQPPQPAPALPIPGAGADPAAPASPDQNPAADLPKRIKEAVDAALKSIDAAGKELLDGQSAIADREVDVIKSISEAQTSSSERVIAAIREYGKANIDKLTQITSELSNLKSQVANLRVA
ncbi:MAG TPA: hypothetical protein PLS03_03010, partial [Terrimicrobiaceae bacterium]|nr:hypothetical protein [Terrimicrobiaceae bacterium]